VVAALTGALLICAGAAVFGRWPVNRVGLFLCGVLVGVGVWVWDAPPEYVERWRRGADGERMTARMLRRVEGAGWCVVHDLPSQYGNFDHVVAGPGGLFLLDSKRLTGDPAVVNGKLVVQRSADVRDAYTLDLVPRMRGAAAELARRIQDETGERLWVTPVVVVWPALLEDAVECSGVWFLSGPCVGDWLFGLSVVDGQQRRVHAVGLLSRRAG
jgi:hypothetical protein